MTDIEKEFFKHMAQSLKDELEEPQQMWSDDYTYSPPKSKYLIQRYMDWCHDAGEPGGILLFSFGFLFFAMTGIMFLALIHDFAVMAMEDQNDKY